MSLTKAQRRTLETIAAFVDKNGYPPTIREICEIDNLKTTSAPKMHLDSLYEKGYITYEPRKSRTIKILKSSDE